MQALRAVGLLAAIYAAPCLAAAQDLAQPQVISPEVHADNTITLRLFSRDARSVAVDWSGLDHPVPMQKDAKGVWTLSMGPLAPDLYEYQFIVDGVGMSDPSIDWPWPDVLANSSQVQIPASPAAPWEVKNCPQGVVHRHFYWSKVTADPADFYVYTPPGYDAKSHKTYPVLYLLHAADADAYTWVREGRINTILDNLLVQGKIEPMIAVMPLSYGVADIYHHLGHTPEARDPIWTENNIKFGVALLSEVMPKVEAEYRVGRRSADRAIAGASMGGGEAIRIALTHLGTFAWVGSFSGGLGVDTDHLDSVFPDVDAKTNEAFRVLWMAHGSEETGNFSRLMHGWFDSRGIRNTAVQRPGAHNMMNWRRNAIEFSQLLFRDR